MNLQFALDYANDWRSRDRSRASDARAEAMVVLADEVLRLRAELARRVAALESGEVHTEWGARFGDILNIWGDHESAVQEAEDYDGEVVSRQVGPWTAAGAS